MKESILSGGTTNDLGLDFIIVCCTQKLLDPGEMHKLFDLRERARALNFLLTNVSGIAMPGDYWVWYASSVSSTPGNVQSTQVKESARIARISKVTIVRGPAAEDWKLDILGEKTPVAHVLVTGNDYTSGISVVDDEGFSDADRYPKPEIITGQLQGTRNNLVKSDGGWALSMPMMGYNYVAHIVERMQPSSVRLDYLSSPMHELIMAAIAKLEELPR